MINETSEYDELYHQAQDFLKHCKDKDKCEELLRILNQSEEDKASEMKAIEQKEK